MAKSMAQVRPMMTVRMMSHGNKDQGAIITVMVKLAIVKIAEKANPDDGDKEPSMNGL